MGRFYGNFYYLSGDRAVYIAHRKRSEIFHKRTAWCIDVATLEECKALGIKYVGVVTQNSVGKFFYLTLLEDFYGEFSFAHFGETRQRGLPVMKFRFHPGLTVPVIEKAVKVR